MENLTGENTSQSEHRDEREPRRQSDNRKFAIGLARAFGGAIIFSLPMMMTMEMWHLGFYMSPARLALFLFIVIPLLIGLSHFVGFEETFGFVDDALDTFVAYAVGFLAAAVMLLLFGIIAWDMSAGEIIGKVALQAIPGSIGAMLAQSQLGVKDEKAEQRKQDTRFSAEIFFMAVGALFLAFNLAPTEEMILIAYKINDWHRIALVLLSLLVMHSFVYLMEFQGQSSVPKGTSFWSLFVRFTVAGYAIALLISLYVLWTFGRTDGLTFYQAATIVIVLGLPAAIGAAAARLVL